jgi:hypothetical protein
VHLRFGASKFGRLLFRQFCSGSFEFQRVLVQKVPRRESNSC